MRYDRDYLLSLIPAIYRVRDYVREDEPHGPLEALIDAIAVQLSTIELNIEQLYDDLFIETCADWVVPYIGDLIGYAPLRGASSAVSSPRAEVASTIELRRRKGTLTVIEQLANDVTGWPAIAIECFTQLAQTEYLNHIRPDRVSTASMRSPLPAQISQSPFLNLPRSVDVRRVASGRGLWNIPDIAIYLWRLSIHNVMGGTPGTPDATHPERFTFHPLGLDAPLYQPVRSVPADQAHADAPEEVPGLASPRLLYAELEQRRALLAIPATPGAIEAQAVGFTTVDPILRITINGIPIDPQFIEICDLSLWTPSPIAGIQASVDPKLGRFVLAAAPGALPVAVDYWYGFPGDVGAGAYARTDLPSTINVAASDNLSSVINAALVPGDADVRVPVSTTFAGAMSILLNPGQNLDLRAGSRSRPVILGALTIKLALGSQITLSGILVSGGIVIEGALGSVKIDNCTVPRSATPSIAWTATAGGALTISSSLLGALQLDPLVQVTIAGSVIDSGADTNAAIASKTAGEAAGALSLDNCTVIGTVAVREADLVQNCLLTGIFTSTRTQQGCIRFTYLPTGSITPHRYQCQPETAIRMAVAAAQKAGATSAQLAAITASETLRVRPDFTSVDIANPAYAQLGLRCASEIATGAENGAEMGVYSSLQQAQKAGNLQTRLAEYLRIGLEAGTFYAN